MPHSLERCYPAGQRTPLVIVGYALLAAGLLLLFICIPCWAWFALLGVGFIIAGWLLLKIGKAWR